MPATTQYVTGTVTVTNGSTTVTGAGTAWLSEVTPGAHYFAIKNENVWYGIASVANDGALTLTSAYTSSTKTAQDYVIQRNFTSNQGYMAPGYGDVNISAMVRDTVLKLDSYIASFSPLNSSMNGAITVSGDLDLNLSGVTGNLVFTGSNLLAGPYVSAAAQAAGSRNNSVTANGVGGNITLCSATTTANQLNFFTVTNSYVELRDTIVLSQRNGAGRYLLAVTDVANGSFEVSVFSPLAVTTAEAPVLNFAVIKAV